MSQELFKIWAETEQYLLAARATVEAPMTGENGFSEIRFLEYIDHNELGLALTELEGIPIFNEVPHEFWQLLLNAAAIMGIEEKIAEFKSRL